MGKSRDLAGLEFITQSASASAATASDVVCVVWLRTATAAPHALDERLAQLGVWVGLA
jgi:hypothetical protein